MKYWNSEEFEISSYRWGLSERMNRSYKTSGTDNTGLCTYTYNELGFRGDSISKEGFKVMSIGCSNTEGVGVNSPWPAEFCKLIPNSVNLNFGTGGRSNDFISRCLISYYDKINPDLVLIMYTNPHRREYYTEDGGIEPFTPVAAWGYFKETENGCIIQKNLTSIQNDHEDLVNWYKNHLLIKLFLESKKCKWIWNGWFGIPHNFEDEYRFDGEFGNFLDYGVDGKHPGELTHKKYATDLRTHLVKNKSEYLLDY